MRESGILLHVSSLPSDYGIGTFGKEAYKFIDFLKENKIGFWQVLPLNPTGYGDSPYQSSSAFAGNPYFIDFDLLSEEKLLNKSDYADYGDDKEVDFGKQFEKRYRILKKAYTKFIKKDDLKKFNKFCKDNKYWLDDFSIFMAIKTENNNKSWEFWSEDLKLKNTLEFEKEHEKQINFWKFMQFKFFQQWDNVRNYANSNGIKIIGDMPIYVSYDSCDVWANKELFDLDSNYLPKEVSGVPPDGFAKEGQLWGNPLYNWGNMKQNKFSWWVKRIEHSLILFDRVRIDHFKGFDKYYAIPYGNKNAVDGKWKQCPGKELFKVINDKLNNPDIIAEDLGYITKSTKQLLKFTGYPGMKIMLFAYYGEDNEFLPEHHIKHCIVYTGTHDNETIKGWYKNLDRVTKKRFRKKTHTIIKNPNDVMIYEALNSVAELVVIPMQDYLKLDNSARMNTPSTLGINWKWRLNNSYDSKKLRKYINTMLETTNRIKK